MLKLTFTMFQFTISFVLLSHLPIVAAYNLSYCDQHVGMLANLATSHLRHQSLQKEQVHVLHSNRFRSYFLNQQKCF